MPELATWEEVTCKTVPRGTWAHKRQWLSDYIGHMSETNPDTGENLWMEDDADYNATWELFPLFDGRLNLEANGEMWPNAITPITCGLLLVEPGIDELIETVVYLGERIEPWVAGGLSEQPLWWIEAMHAVKAGRSRLLVSHREALKDDTEADN